MTAAELRAEHASIEAQILRLRERRYEIERALPAAVGVEKLAEWEAWLLHDRSARPTRPGEWEEIQLPRYHERWREWRSGRRVVTRARSRTPAGGLRLEHETRSPGQAPRIDHRTVAARTHELDLWRARLVSVP